jgi:Na+/proline symporter
MAARSREVIRRGQLIAMGWGVLAFYGAIFLGHAARLALPDLVDPEQAYPVLAVELLPPLLAGLVLAAIISAMMSTADSQLLVVASAVARDLVEKGYSVRRGTWLLARFTDDPDEARRRAERLGVRLRSDRVLSWVSRLSVVSLGLLALGVALGEVRAVFWFVLFAWSGLGAAFGPPVILALYWSRASWAGCLSGMVTGVVVTVWWKLSLKDAVAEATGLSLYELVPAFALSMLVTSLVSLAVPDTEEDIREAEALLAAGED